VLYGSDDVAPSGTSIYISNGSLVHAQGVLLAGAETADATSTADSYAFVFPAATTSMGGAAMTAGQCVSQDVAVPSIRTNANATVLVTPTTYPGDGFWWDAFIPSNGVIRVKLCAAVAGTPVLSVYKVRGFQ
jgi:hypothetical protein